MSPPPFKSFPLFLFLVLSAYGSVRTKGQEYEIVAEWNALEFTDDIDQADFDFKNNILIGLKVGQGGDIYVSIPRWLPGVPSTLNKLMPKEGEEPKQLLQPYPSIEMQHPGK